MKKKGKDLKKKGQQLKVSIKDPKAPDVPTKLLEKYIARDDPKKAEEDIQKLERRVKIEDKKFIKKPDTLKNNEI